MRKGFVVLIAAFALAAAGCLAHITGGGFIADAEGEGKANFGFNLNCAGHGDNKGHVTYHDKSAGLKVKGTVTECLPSGAVGTWEAQGKSTYTSGTFVVTAVDDGEPGTTDTFEITLFEGLPFASPVVYSNGGPLLGGNVQDHG